MLIHASSCSTTILRSFSFAPTCSGGVSLCLSRIYTLLNLTGACPKNPKPSFLTNYYCYYYYLYYTPSPIHLQHYLRG